MVTSRPGSSPRASSAPTAAHSTSAFATGGSSASAAARSTASTMVASGRKGSTAGRPINAEDRLLRPLVRRNGQLDEASWDEAMELVVERSRELLATKGPGALGFYTTGQLFLEDYYTLAARRPRRDRHQPPRRQHAPLHRDRRAVAEGDVRLRRPAAGSYDIDVVRHDSPRRHQHRRDADRPLDARARPATRARSAALVVIDPRETASAREADVHLAIAPRDERRHPERSRASADRERLDRPRVRRLAHDRVRLARAHRRLVHAGAGRRDLRRPGGRHSPRRGDPRQRRSAADVRAPGRLPVAPGDRRRVRRRTTSTCSAG